MKTCFCSNGKLIMSDDHCYKNILFLVPSGTLSQEETFCFVPFIFLLMTNCRRERVGNMYFLDLRTFPSISYNFLTWCIVTNGIKLFICHSRLLLHAHVVLLLCAAQQVMSCIHLLSYHISSEFYLDIQRADLQ